ncbi:MAG: hypothetical protein M1832_003565 [Thelocarpon impressellum]|nr:MAG: hypothetical protein M1832_003565 [Thelocarpon impressellum]
MPAQWIRPISSPSERGFLPRLQDALTGKGADIFIGDTRHRGPRGAEWSRLPSPYYPAADALSAHEHLLEREGLIERDDAARGVDDSRTPPWARRGRKRFDPVSRTYKEWGPHWRDGPRDGSLVPRDGELRVARAFGARGGAVEAFGELRPWKRAFWDDVRWDDALPPPFPRLLPGLRGRGVWDGGYWVDGYDYYDDSYGDSDAGAVGMVKGCTSSPPGPAVEARRVPTAP